MECECHARRGVEELAGGDVEGRGKGFAGAGDFVGALAVDEGAAEIAAAAVRCVGEKIRRFETGIGSATRVQALRGTLTGGPAGAGLRRETETVVA